MLILRNPAGKYIARLCVAALLAGKCLCNPAGKCIARLRFVGHI